ncbi:MAG TPA: superoxide dismutase [Roseomonas sp.]|nr:superoxide dismutase [Roseomonas sp.]
MTTPIFARRTAFTAGASLLVAGLLGSHRVLAQGPAPAATGPFSLPPLPYAKDALEPHIDAATMELHHDKHHAAYVTNLNGALKDQGQLAGMKLEDLLAKLGEAPEAVRTTIRNNGGGHANHSMFWQIMGGKGGNPSGELAQAIDRDLGGFDKFKADFNAAGGRVFGSGWVFVTVDRDGKLALTTRPNQDTPLMDGQRVLMGNDVWEHAYYLKYNNRRADYLSAWWNVVNWDSVAKRYAAAKDGTLGI